MKRLTILTAAIFLALAVTLAPPTPADSSHNCYDIYNGIECANWYQSAISHEFAFSAGGGQMKFQCDVWVNYGAFPNHKTSICLAPM